MASRDGRATPGRRDYPDPDIEAMAITTAAIIAGLRSRLKEEEILIHPMVDSQLQALLLQLHVILEDPDPGA